MKENPDDKILEISAPRLNHLEKLYVRVYLNTLSHIKAYEVVNPGLKAYHNSNPYSNRENIKFHIALKLQEKAEAIGITPESIIGLLYKEATMYGSGTNQAARVQSLQILGKHLGLFTEKKAEASHTIQIINYGSSEIEVKEQVERIEEIPEESLPLNIIIEDYSNVE